MTAVCLSDPRFQAFADHVGGAEQVGAGDVEMRAGAQTLRTAGVDLHAPVEQSGGELGRRASLGGDFEEDEVRLDLVDVDADAVDGRDRVRKRPGVVVIFSQSFDGFARSAQQVGAANDGGDRPPAWVYYRSGIYHLGDFGARQQPGKPDTTAELEPSRQLLEFHSLGAIPHEDNAHMGMP